MSNGVRSTIASLLCLALLSVSVRPALGQSPPVPHMLRIVVVEDDDTLIRPSTVQEPIVQVQDENNQPVAGAMVVFTVSGTSGEFMNGARSITVATNQQGRAKAAGFRPNSQNGEFVLQVLATLESLRAETVIRGTNVSATADAIDEPTTKPPANSHSKWILIGGALAAGAVAAALAGRGSSSGGAGGRSSSSSAVTITPGTGTVSAPAK